MLLKGLRFHHIYMLKGRDFNLGFILVVLGFRDLFWPCDPDLLKSYYNLDQFCVCTYVISLGRRSVTFLTFSEFFTHKEVKGLFSYDYVKCWLLFGCNHLPDWGRSRERNLSGCLRWRTLGRYEALLSSRRKVRGMPE